METDPRKVRLSNNFLLSDFLGNHSVFSSGLSNVFDFRDEDAQAKIDNAKALCEHGLEPILKSFGPVSISYGYISPAVSRSIVKYQDPNKPSHHRWDLGAACDFVAHRWVAGEFKTIDDLFLPETAVGSPIALAHAIDYLGVPYSRMITYSESPYVCLALSDTEVRKDRPRKAFYENRFTGRAKVKPDYRQYASAFAKSKAFEELQTNGLDHDWQGAGHPTYHGGGRSQYQHARISKYTVLTDWLFDLKSISNGEKNIPSMSYDAVQDAFAAAGLVYDWMVETLEVPRLSIVEGYVSHLSKYSHDYNDWRDSTIRFVVSVPTEGGNADESIGHRLAWLELWSHAGVQFTIEAGYIVVVVDVNTVLSSAFYG